MHLSLWYRNSRYIYIIYIWSNFIQVFGAIYISLYHEKMIYQLPWEWEKICRQLVYVIFYKGIKTNSVSFYFSHSSAYFFSLYCFAYEKNLDTLTSLSHSSKIVNSSCQSIKLAYVVNQFMCVSDCGLSSLHILSRTF